MRFRVESIWPHARARTPASRPGPSRTWFTGVGLPTSTPQCELFVDLRAQTFSAVVA